MLSVVRSLREGFWPWAITGAPGFPVSCDYAKPLVDTAQIAFASEQCDAEVAQERFSRPFGPMLLPGMSSVPIHVVPKPRSAKMRLIVDHSAGEFSLNRMIPKDDGRVVLDTPLLFSSLTLPRPIVVSQCTRCGRFGRPCIWRGLSSQAGRSSEVVGRGRYPARETQAG